MSNANAGFTWDTLLRKKIEKLRRKAKDVRIHNRLSTLLWLHQGHCTEQIATLLGVCPRTVRNWLDLYHRGGLPGLIPQRPGPRHAHKLSDPIVDFLSQQQLRDPMIRPHVLAELLRQQFDLAVHPRSIERALERRRKKPQ